MPGLWDQCRGLKADAKVKKCLVCGLTLVSWNVLLCRLDTGTSLVMARRLEGDASRRQQDGAFVASLLDSCDVEVGQVLVFPFCAEPKLTPQAGSEVFLCLVALTKRG